MKNLKLIMLGMTFFVGKFALAGNSIVCENDQIVATFIQKNNVVTLDLKTQEDATLKMEPTTGTCSIQLGVDHFGLSLKCPVNLSDKVVHLSSGLEQPDLEATISEPNQKLIKLSCDY